MKLKEISSSVVGPWMVMGDFNNVLTMTKRIGSVVKEGEVKGFRDYVEVCGLVDAPAQGPFFTWNNKQEPGKMVFCRIDRVMVNDDWIMVFPDTLTMFYPEGLFDHCPCTVTMWPEYIRKKGAFKYYNMWGKDEQFLNVVSTHWNLGVRGVMMFQIVKKLKSLKKPLRELNSLCYANIEDNARIALAVTTWFLVDFNY